MNFSWKCGDCGKPVDLDEISVSREYVETKCCGSAPVDPETGIDQSEEVAEAKAADYLDRRDEEAYQRYKDREFD